MSKLKESSQEIVILKGGREGAESSVRKNSQLSKGKTTRIIHPPIESHWTLPPPGGNNRYSSSTSGIKSMLTYPLKVRDSIKKLGRSKSLQTALEGTRGPKDEQLVQSFRELLFLEGLLPGKQTDYHTLLRFLRMRDFDLPRAKDMFVNYIKWRESFRVDTIAKELNFEEYSELKKCYPHGYHGVDRCGRPIYIERVGMIELDALLRSITIERFVKYHVSEQEKTMNVRFPACSVAAKMHIASITSIFDVKEVGMSNFSKTARRLFLEIQKIDSNYYPETLHKLFIVNAGSGFRVLWKALKASLDARTLAKIQVLGSNYQSKLLEVIDPSNLPTFLGGNCTCSEYGGCLFSDKGPWNNPEVTEMLQAVSATEGMYNNEENIGGASEKALVKAEDNSAQDQSPGRRETGKTNFVQKLETQNIQALEAALQDFNHKLQALETALEDTKMVLKKLAQHVAALRI